MYTVGVILIGFIYSGRMAIMSPVGVRFRRDSVKQSYRKYLIKTKPELKDHVSRNALEIQSRWLEIIVRQVIFV